MRSWVWALLLLMLAGPVVAQATPRTCDTAEKANFRRIRNSRGEETIFIQGPTRFVCTGGVDVMADSAVWRRTTGELELIRHVFYRDSTRTLRADWANFLGRTSTLYARGSVLLTDLQSGSVVRGQRLEYQQQTDERPAGRAIVEGGRPHATLYPAGDSIIERPTGPGMMERPVARRDTTPPIEVDADWMEFLGTGLFRAKDDVEIVRGETDAYADSAEFDQTGGRLALRRDARVVDPQYRLAADSIDAYLTDDALRDVEAVGMVQLHSEDLQVTAPRLSIGFVDGQFQDMRAWVPGRLAALAAATPAPAGPGGAAPDTAEGPARVQGGAVQPTPGMQPDSARPVPTEPPVARPDTTPAGPPPVAPDSAHAAPAAAVADTMHAVRAAPTPDSARMVGPDTAVAAPAGPDSVVADTGESSSLPPGAPAAHWGADATYADSVQAVALAKEFRLEADSIHAVAPEQQLDRVIAIGQAYGVRLGDSLGVNLPPEAAHDWVRGDTIIGFFVADTVAAPPADSVDHERATRMRRHALRPDTTGIPPADSVPSPADSVPPPADSTVQRTLKRVIVVGGAQPARSLYRIRQQDTASVGPGQTPRAPARQAADTVAADTTAADTAAANTAAANRPGINYMTAQRITLHFKDGEVQRVEAEGPIKGLYLDPAKRTEPADTAGAPKIAKPNG